MLRIALKMLLGDRAKYVGLIFGITFTSFLVTFAASYFAGIMTRGYAPIAENGAVDVWVMDPAVNSVEQTTNMSLQALARVRSVAGVQSAVPLMFATADVRFPDGRYQPFQVIGVDDATLIGMPPIQNDVMPSLLRVPDAVVVDAGGTIGKLETSLQMSDQGTRGKLDLDAPTRELMTGDELLINDHSVRILGQSQGLPRFPPRPLLYTTFSNATRILPPERRQLTFVLVKSAPKVAPEDLAIRIESATGLRARTSAQFKSDTVHWFLLNSEDVGDIGAMLTLAISVGFGVTGVMLYMFTNENLRNYAVLSAMGATPRLLLTMVFAQAGLCGLLGTGLGLGLCAMIGQMAIMAGYPFRMMWFTPVLGAVIVVLVCLVAAALSVRPVLKMEPSQVFSGR